MSHVPGKLGKRSSAGRQRVCMFRHTAGGGGIDFSHDRAQAIDQVAVGAGQTGAAGAAGMDDSGGAGQGLRRPEKPHLARSLGLAVGGRLLLPGRHSPNATFWAQVIAATDHPVSWYTALRAFYVSAIAKYIPGKAMVLVLRAGMMRPRWFR